MKKILPLFLIITFFSCTNQSIKEIPYTIIKGKVTHRPISNKTKNRIKGMPETLLKRKEVALVSNAIRAGLDVPNHNVLIN